MAEAKPATDCVHLDDVLTKFPIFCRYYLLNFILISFAYMTNAIYSTNYVFAAQDIDYSCNGLIDCITKDGVAVKETFDKRCYQYAYNNTVANSNVSCSDLKMIPCRQWTYEVPNGFVSEFNIGCQDWKRTLIGTIHSFGYMLGLLIVGPLSDRLGRKKLIIFTGVFGGLMGISKSFSSWYWLYVALEFLEAAFGDICSPIFTLTVELVAKEKLILYQMLISFSFSIGGAALAFTAWYVPYWRHFLRVIYAPALLYALYAFLIDESPRWLLSKGKKEKALAILDKAANLSKLELNKNELSKLSYTEIDEKTTTCLLLKNTFKSSVLLKRFLICVTWWITCTFTNYGLTINSVSLKGNKYVNYALMSFVDVPVCIVGIFILTKYKRKVPLITSFLLGGALCVVQPLLPDKSWLIILFYFAGKCMAYFSFLIIYIYTSELFPTYTRNSMHALCSSFGRIGSIIAPQTPLLMRYWPHLPTLLFGVSSLAAGLLTLLVPEAADKALPDTVRQAEEVGGKDDANTNNL